jgi:signal transduction histidine kinase/ActR/RegA family two-component response regulator
MIATELLTLIFAMNTLSAVRAFVAGEAIWSKAQKDAVHNLERYVVTSNRRFYLQFLENLKIPAGDRVARLELEAPVMDMQKLRDGFLAGGNHPDDIQSVVNLMRRFSDVPHVQKAVAAWREGDSLIDELQLLGVQIDNEVSKGIRKRNNQKISEALDEIYVLNQKLTAVETDFSNTLGAASRWVEGLLAAFLILLVITIEGTGLGLTFIFSRRLTTDLQQLNVVADKVGNGEFDVDVPVNSKDEVGQLALSLKHMVSNIQQLIDDKRTAVHASQTKNLFLANMSHEIRTPLNAILGFTELMRDPELSDSDKIHYLDIIKRTGNNLATIINDILDLSKVEADQMEVETEVFSLSQLMQDLYLLLGMRAKEKGIEFKIQKKGEVSECIQTDPGRLRQVLLNLAGNAIKFTERGSVNLSYEVRGHYLFFTVKDTGKGIPKTQLNSLFKPFSQGDSSVSKKFGGTGLGLILSKKLAQLMGGDIGLLESTYQRGSTFYIKVAYQPVYEGKQRVSEVSQEQKAPQNFEKLAGKKVLIVEDTKDNQVLLNLYLAKVGMKVSFADNGEEGIKKALIESYDIVLMDMQMPVKDGYEATKELRSKGYQVPIVALTGYAMKGDREKCLRAGCNDYIAKPVSKSQLMTTVHQLVVKEETNETVAQENFITV